MSPNPSDFIAHLQKAGYHPRSDKHSNALANAIVKDLVSHCELIRIRAESGELVYSLNFDIEAATATWNVDLVIGRPPLGEVLPQPSGAIRASSPASIDIAIEIKSVMTEHRKAVKNRKRDLEAHHEHIHKYDDSAIAGGVLVINGSSTFKSPLKTVITRHNDPTALMTHCLSELNAVSYRNRPDGTGLDAKCAIIVDCENIDSTMTNYILSPPAPQAGSPLYYDAFIQRICQVYTQRKR